MSLLDQVEPERFDQRALANAGNAADADAVGSASLGEDGVQELLGNGRVGRSSALDQRNGLGKARAVARENARCE